MMQFLSDKDIVVFDLDDTLYKEIDIFFRHIMPLQRVSD